MKAEAAGISKAAGMSAPDFCSKAASSILYYPKASSLRCFQNFCHVGAEAEEMYRDDADRARPNQRRKPADIDIESCGVNIAENRASSHVFDDICGRDPRERGNDYFIPRLKCQASYGQVQGASGCQNN